MNTNDSQIDSPISAFLFVTKNQYSISDVFSNTIFIIRYDVVQMVYDYFMFSYYKENHSSRE